MYDTLKSKLEHWSLSRLSAAAQHLPIAPLGDRDVGFTEQGIDELFLIKKYQVIYFKDDGTIATLIHLDSTALTDNDFNAISLLPTTIRIARPISTTLDNHYRYTSYSSPCNLGVPFVADYFINHLQFNDTYLINFVDQITPIIKSLEIFPDRFIGLENRLKDEEGYYFYNITNFNSTATDFIEMQIAYLQTIIDTPIFVLDNKEALISYARTQWQ
jgi:hypothetical protein